MKWVIGSIAVLVALGVGILVGWVMRGRADEPLWKEHVAKMSAPPPVTRPPPFTTPSPSTTTTRPRAWVDDTQPFAWPSSASDDVVAVDATHYLVKCARTSSRSDNSSAPALRSTSTIASSTDTIASCEGAVGSSW
jgi:hypothetical protein